MKKFSSITQRYKNQKGFTLVELIVVIVILAILAAMLVPALLGYIDRARQNQDVLNAKNCLTASQAYFSQMYATRKDTDTCAISGYSKSSGLNSADVDLDDTDIAKSILKVADDEPYAFLVGLGKYSVYKDSNIRKAYKVYFAAYCATKDSKPIFFDGEKWGPTYPWVEHKQNDGANKFNGVELQMYIINAGNANKNGDKIWNFLRTQAEKK